MEPKLAFYALDGLINKEWKSSFETHADKSGALVFRGFRGTYRFSWVTAAGDEETMTAHLQ